jgi:hypothetical protein
MTTERQARAFRETDYKVAGAVARVGRRAPGVMAKLRGLGAGQGGFITAWNPMARRFPPNWNRRAAARLEAACRRLPHLPGQGAGRGWAEDHLLVATDPRRLAVLGRRFRQKAVLVLGRPGIPRLLWL